jgi:hypothetical protein
VSFPFVEPPQAVTGEQYGPGGKNLKWLHDEGDGGWFMAVQTLLADRGQYASMSHGAAQRIVTAVVTHDPNNPHLPQVKDWLASMNLVYPAPHPGNLLADVRVH